MRNFLDTPKSYRRKQARKFGVPLQVIEGLYHQAQHCEICNGKYFEPRTDGKKPKRPELDHSHSTGKIRSIICRDCNTMLGCAQDNIETLKRAVLYLEQHREQPVPAYATT